MKTEYEWLQLVDNEFGNYMAKNYDSEFKHGDGWEELITHQIKYNNVKSDVIDFELVDSYGGEGEGETYYKVFKITNKQTNEEVFIKFDGFYDSWNGTEWEYDPFFVKPVEKTIIDYEKI